MKIPEAFRTIAVTSLIWIITISTPAAFRFPYSEEHFLITEYAATVNVTSTTIGTSITVNWTAPEGHAANDYIRLARKNDGESSYYWTQNTGPASSGSFSVPVPNEVNRFEFRMFRGTDNSRITQSSTFVANKADYSLSVNPLQIAASGDIIVSWTAPIGRPTNDQIIICPSNSSAILDQKYIGSATSSTLTFNAPPTPGEYEIRYLEAIPLQYAAISQAFTVTAAEGWFAGRIRNADSGDYIMGALVEALQGGLVKATTTTNTSGGFNIPLSIVGTYDLRVTAAGFPTAHRAGVVLSSGNTTELNFELSNKGSVVGSVTRSGTSMPISGASVYLKQGTTTIANRTTDAAGHYDFTSITPGTFSVEVYAAGYTSQVQTGLNVTAGQTLSVNLSLPGGQQGSGNNLEYIYDAAGRLTAIKEQGLLTKIYSYDPTGNLLSILSPPTNTPAIIDFSPRFGPSGTQVVIRGVNFGMTTGQNSITFNGVPATILSESSTELTVTVPATANSGLIAVVSPLGSAASSSPFIVGTGQTGQSPTITGFFPAVGHSGAIVTISGNNFEPETSDNDVRFGATGSPVNSGSTNSLLVPANTSSGKISVTTPYGSALSLEEFYSVPGSVDVTKVDPRGRTWFGHTKHVGIVGNDRRAVYSFDGYAGKRISLKLLYLNRSVKIEIYRPDGRLLTSGGFSSQYDFIDATVTPQTGTYTIIATPLGAGSSMYFASILYDVPPDITGEMPVNNFRQVTFSTPGQNGNLTFTAEAGQRIILKISDHTFGGTANIKQRLGNGPIGTGPMILGPPVTGTSFIAFNENYTMDGVSIPATGTYNIELNPAGPSIGSMTVSLFIVAGDAEYTMDIGTSKTASTAARGQNAWVNFDAVAGQRASLLARDVTYPTGFVLSMNKPDGSYLRGPANATNNTFVDTLDLPVTGRYKIFVNPPGFDMGSVTFDLFNVPPNVVATTSINGSPITVNAAVPGHNPSVSFSGLQGQQARVNVSSATVPNNTPVSIKKPDGSVLAYGIINAGSGLISSTALPTAGTYTVEINPAGMNLGNATIAVGGDVFGTVTPGGASMTTTIDNPGQSSWLTFNGTAGQRISVKLTNVTIASGTASIRTSDGSLLSSLAPIGPSATNFIDTVTLPSNGQYSVVIDPNGESTGSANVNAYNVPADAAGSITIGAGQTKTTTIPGQNLALTFAGTANQRISIELTSVTIPNGILRIKKPDASDVTWANFYSYTSGTVINNAVLPISGNYQVFIDPSNDSMGSVTLQLFGTGTGNPNPTVQLWQSISVLKGFSSNLQSSPFSSVSVSKGVVSGSSTDSQMFSSVSVTKGPYIAALSPIQTARGATVVLTISGRNLETVNNLRFIKSDGNSDSTFTITNINVNPEGTVLTVSIQTTGSTLLGERMVVVTSPDVGSSQTENMNPNIINIIP